MATTPASWRFWLPLAAQIALIIGLPSQAILTYVAGETVMLQTVPVDPYDLLRGYSQTLSYQISNLDNLRTLPGWNGVYQAQEQQPDRAISFYLTLTTPVEPSTTERPAPWQPVAIGLTPPDDLDADEVTLQGVLQYNQVAYGLERYYMPEDQRDRINDEITDLNRRFGNNPPMGVEIRVRDNGASVPVTLWVGDRAYRF
ncbi:GDYXXLXY domain-containing protein [Spirulina major CS-329]|uniref:GDYXXLXY domain-containing protein n=1 Tax=Spirulina TaxID=1154 RepID=UPI00232AADC4|nr:MULTISPECIES: GDYXXLXY domain-containing protein [Spirulina]MDB9495131.1 GDYXXLXY domain-containing protein [Spirulina subsalsa CS-330]MDB9503622.1 GDYXXLXY domain-containing protein [Spirulina major CS-329]